MPKIQRMPNRNTQHHVILTHLLSGRTINQVTSAGLYGVSQLSGAISHLKQMGWEISSKRYRGVRGNYAEYKLVKED